MKPVPVTSPDIYQPIPQILPPCDLCGALGQSVIDRRWLICKACDSKREMVSHVKVGHVIPVEVISQIKFT